MWLMLTITFANDVHHRIRFVLTANSKLFILLKATIYYVVEYLLKETHKYLR